jgi:cation diffusion facilitator CzcD-associated flavoprotein CzcO
MQSEAPSYDAIVVGAGFSGLYALYKLRDELGLRARVFEMGEGVGGTWFWNRYPGARCDSESYYYCYSFSPELAQEWEWSGRYPEQPEIERYLNHVADRFDLRRDIQLSARVASARFDDAASRWEVTLASGERASAQFLITAVGCLSAVNRPSIRGLDVFRGELYYTAEWPREGVNFSGKRVGLIGTGSSGIQATPRIAAEARSLTVFQRTPNFTIPARHTAFPPDQQAAIKRDYAAIFERTRQSHAGFPFFQIERDFADVSERECEEIFDGLWEDGGFKFLWGSFRDLVTDDAANEAASEYIRRKIRETVKDPETAERLCPRGYPYGAKRPPIDTDYYVSFNRENVRLVDIKADPIEEITPTGLRTRDHRFEFDALVLATGFDAMTGSLLRMDIRGARGLRLADAWKEGPRSMLGLAIAGFPNLFTITGPGSPSVLLNMPVAIEHHVDWIADCLRFMRARGVSRIEATEAAQERWARHVEKAARQSIFGRADSWYLGANIPGKPRVVAPYCGGQPKYRERCDAVRDSGYEGFSFDR